MGREAPPSQSPLAPTLAPGATFGFSAQSKRLEQASTKRVRWTSVRSSKWRT